MIYDDMCYICWYMMIYVIYVDICCYIYICIYILICDDICYICWYVLVYIQIDICWYMLITRLCDSKCIEMPSETCYYPLHVLVTLISMSWNLYVSWCWFNSIPTKPGLMRRCVIAPRIHMFENSCSNQQLGLQEELINTTCQRMTAMSSWRCVACVQFVMWAVFKTENGTPLYWLVHGLW